MNRRDALKSAAIGLMSLGLAPHRAAVAQDATPAAGDSASMLAGILSSNVGALPTAGEGEIQIVRQSAPLGKYVGFIIHNNSDQAVGNKNVIGVARDADDALFAVMDIDHVAPYEIGPGGYSIGVATFDRDLPSDATIELAAEFEEIDPERRSRVDLAVTEVNVSDDEVIGIVENQADMDTEGLAYLVGIFLDESGEIVGVVRPYLKDGDIVAGGRTTFSESLDAGAATDSYLFAASGRAAR